MQKRIKSFECSDGYISAAALSKEHSSNLGYKFHSELAVCCSGNLLDLVEVYDPKTCFLTYIALGGNPRDFRVNVSKVTQDQYIAIENEIMKFSKLIGANIPKIKELKDYLTQVTGIKDGCLIGNLENAFNYPIHEIELKNPCSGYIDHVVKRDKNYEIVDLLVCNNFSFDRIKNIPPKLPSLQVKKILDTHLNEVKLPYNLFTINKDIDQTVNNGWDYIIQMQERVKQKDIIYQLWQLLQVCGVI